MHQARYNGGPFPVQRTALAHSTNHPLRSVYTVAFLMATATPYGQTYSCRPIILYTDEQCGVAGLSRSHQGVS